MDRISLSYSKWNEKELMITYYHKSGNGLVIAENHLPDGLRVDILLCKEWDGEVGRIIVAANTLPMIIK